MDSRGGGRGGGRGRGGRGGHDDPLVKTSKALSFLLRHGAQKEGVPIRADGYVKISDIQAWKSLKGISMERITQVVNDNNKKRFEMNQLEDGEWYIRAVQGHTIQDVEDDLLLEKITDASQYPVIIHGTYFKAWDLIKDTGLKTMGRNHVHFAIGMPGESQVISGMRTTCQVFITVDMSQAISDGIDFYVSKNNVVLSSGINETIPPKYFKSVVDVNGKDLLGKTQQQQQQQQ